MLSDKEIAEIEDYVMDRIETENTYDVQGERYNEDVCALLAARTGMQAEIDKLTKQNTNLKKARDKWKRRYGKLILGGFDNVR